MSVIGFFRHLSNRVTVRNELPAPKIPTRKTDAFGTHQNGARTPVRRLERAYIHFTARVNAARV